MWRRRLGEVLLFLAGLVITILMLWCATSFFALDGPMIHPLK